MQATQGIAGGRRFGDPLQVALGWQAAGAEWVHLVDVDAAFERGHNRELLARYVVTDVDKDGVLAGPNLKLLRSVCAATTRPVVASGGIAELADLECLMTLVSGGVEGAIIGAALYQGRFTLADALLLTQHPRGSANELEQG